MRALPLLLSLGCVCFGCAAITPTEKLALSSDHPGNVFLLGEPVQLKVGGATATARVRVTDYEGKELPAPVVAGGTLTLTSLPRGYYEVRVTDGKREANTTLAVVPMPHPRPESPLAVDAAHSELIPPEQFEAGAELLRRAGLTWARERINWPAMEPQRGTYQWGRYEACINAEAKRGIRVVGVFHHSPAWTRKDGDLTRFPDDLRDIYRFAKAAAEHFRGRVAAWEVWNEADAALYSPENASEYAAFLKAAYLGFKAGDPKTQVAQVALATSSGRYAENLYRNGTTAYFDLFNYHIYADPQVYAERAQGHQALLRKYGIPGAPVWVTEAGIILHASSNTLSREDRRRQAEFIPRSYVMSLASGTNRHFFFLFPHYLENGIEYGVLDAEGRIYPGYAALATAVDLLGEGRYRGRVALQGGAGLQAHLFDNGDGETLVLWQDGEAEVALPAGAAGAAVFNCVGAELPSLAAGRTSVKVGSSPVYLRVQKGVFTASQPATRPTGAAPPQPAYAGRNLVLRLRLPKETIRKATEEYEVSPGKPISLGVEVYNLGSKGQSGTVRLQAPAGWKLSPTSFPANLEPMGQKLFRANLTAQKRPSSGVLRGVIAPTPGRPWGPGLPQSAPVALNVALDPASRKPTVEATLKLDSPDRWTDNIAPGGTMTRAAVAGGGVEFSAKFSASGEQWVFPTTTFTPPSDWQRYDGISLEILTGAEDPETQLRLMVGEKSGALYFTDAPLPQSRTWRRVFVPFRGLAPATFAPPDPNNQLDLNGVTFLRFGANTKRAAWKASVRGFRLVRYQP